MAEELTGKSKDLTSATINYYDGRAPEFWHGTKDHDVTQNYDALFDAISGSPPFTLLDLGCGPGRDLAFFRSLGHHAIGLDGSVEFAEMARKYSGAEVWVQNFIELSLPINRFDGVFANATLFHVPKQSIENALVALWKTLLPGGVLFTSNPRGNDEEGVSGGRFGVYYQDETWLDLVKTLRIENGRFEPIRQYFRPPDAPPDQRRWFATVWRKRVRVCPR